ncbi:MAG: DUF3390 domain-containing protein, partial [Myxococcales bacterium]|nr:DUF3390 domain-containing protein [Myxococcales bacterium]
PAAYRAMTRRRALAGKRLPGNAGPLKAWMRHRARPEPAPRTLHQLLRDRPGE